MPPKKDLNDILKISNSNKDKIKRVKKDLNEKLKLGKKSKLPKPNL